MEYDYVEQMEYEYTNPQPYFDADRFKRHDLGYMPPSPGTFQIPESFFNNNYNRASTISDNICNKLNSFKLDETPKQEPKQEPQQEQKELKPDKAVPAKEEKQALVLFSPILSPQENVKELTDQNFTLTSPVDQNDIPLNSPITSSFSQSPTNYHNAFHNYFPPPPDPVAKSRGMIYFLERLFKILFTTIVFCGVMYICVHIVINIKNDANDKILKHESAILEAQMLCRRHFSENKCSSSTRVPAVAEMCRTWETCMIEPIVVSRAKLLGETVGAMFNSFFEQLSLQSKFVLILLSLGTIWAFKCIIVAQLK